MGNFTNLWKYQLSATELGVNEQNLDLIRSFFFNLKNDDFLNFYLVLYYIFLVKSRFIHIL